MTPDKRQITKCPKCHSQLKAIIDNKLVCVGIGCDYIYREDKQKKFRLEDKNIVELKEGWK